MIQDYYLNKTQIGRVNKEVQIDEPLFNRRKYNRGRFKLPYWVFGGIESESKKCFLHIVSDRSQNTLHSIIKNEIMQGSDVVTDGWKGYKNIDKLGYNHFIVNHKENLTNPENNRNTQRIENLWMLAKKKIHAEYGINKEDLKRQLDKFLWRRNMRITFAEFINIIN
ncbi:hypothetical protein DMUE_0881 [Dictyocoela muelleri]|nr:hypothetical protein DMUE_0881 [Dictyocoela muelleri]